MTVEQMTHWKGIYDCGIIDIREYFNLVKKVVDKNNGS